MDFSPIAQQAPDLLEFINYGVLGLLVLAMLFDKIIPGPSHQRAVQESSRKDEEIQQLRAEVAELNKYIAEQVVPALVRSTDVQAQALRFRVQQGGTEVAHGSSSDV